MKFIISLFLTVFSITIVYPQQTVTIKGTIKGDLENYKKIYVYDRDVADSIEIVNNTFSITLPYKKNFSKAMFTEYALKKFGGYSIFEIIADKPGVILIDNIDITQGLETGTISGIQSAVDFKMFKNESKRLFSEINTIMHAKYPNVSEYFYRNEENTPEQNAVLEETEKMTKERMPEIVYNFVKEHPDSYASVYILDGSAKNYLDYKAYNKTFNLLSKQMQNSELGKNISQFIKGLKQSEIGNTIKEFRLKTPDNKTISSKQFKGKYLLIDFWASWCRPCIASFPELEETYKKYKSSKFEILSISTDKNDTAWHKAINTYKLPWPQVIDDKETVANNFAVSYIPATFLIDPNGTIIATGHEDIQNKIEELFGKK